MQAEYVKWAESVMTMYCELGKKRGNVLRFCFLISLENKGMLFTTVVFLVSNMMVLNCLWKIITNNWKILLSQRFT